MSVLALLKRLLLPAAVSALMVGAAQAQVGADINISPKRLVFAPGERSATVYIFNQGDQEATYTVEMIDRVMLPDGQIIAAAERPNARLDSAGALIDYTPRRITLAPRQSQAIRVRARPGAAGEHRIHLTVTALPSASAGFTVEQAAKPGGGEVGLQVVALFSVSIPVIVRDGPVDARAAIENVSAKPGSEGAVLLSMDLVRQGANSVYGDVEVRAGDANGKLLTAVRGLAVYPEIDRRAVTAVLPAGLKSGQAVTIVYRDDDARPGEALASATLVAP